MENIANNPYEQFSDIIAKTKINNILFMTVLNHGYLLYTMNMLKSLEKWNLDKKILLICLDEKAYLFLVNRGYNAIWADLHIEMSKFKENDHGKEYLTICFFKWLAVSNMLKMGHDVLYTDGDIVYINNPIEHLTLFIKDNDNHELFIQNDGQHDNLTSNLCTGYFFVRSNDITKKQFSIDNRIQEHNFFSGSGDQLYLNLYMKQKLLFKVFPLKTHPNGGFLYNNPNVKNYPGCIMVHFNWVVGHMKNSKMKEHLLWLLTETEEAEIMA